MSALSAEELQQLALGEWRKGKALSQRHWKLLARTGLYSWAAEHPQRLAVPGDSAIPSLEMLLALPVASSVAPDLTLEASPAPARTGAKKTTQRMLNRQGRATNAVLARRSGEQAVAFAPRDFVMFSLPHKRLKQNFFERVNGNYRFRLDTGGTHFVPFGQDRLVPLWLATAFKAAGQPADNRIRFRSASDILAAFRMTVDGGARKALTERFERWFHTTLYVYDESIPERRLFRSYRLLEGGQLWYQRNGGSTNQYTLWQNVLVLDPRFAESLRNSTIPVDFETVVALRDMPGALDLYVWQAHRSWELARQGASRPVVIPLALLRGQLGSQSPGRKGKQLLINWQSIVKEVWPHCPNFFDAKRELFFLHPGKAVFERTTTELPGVMPRPPVPLRALEGPSRPADGLFLGAPKPG